MISAYFQNLRTGLAVLHVAGITNEKMLCGQLGEPRPVQAFRALTGWLRRAKKQDCLAKCDIETLPATVLQHFRIGRSLRVSAANRRRLRPVSGAWSASSNCCGTESEELMTPHEPRDRKRR